ncbi:putative gustatory receptor 28b [Temnothorax americanus]|uniref:putative gustatory receptor 28b n=1 Tax=Temnothorax americanus TaxID=1964332 RepID=UPI004068DD2C
MTTITTVQQAVHSLLLTCGVFGIGICSPKKFYLNILYNLTVWISYGCLCYYVITALKAGNWFLSTSNIVHIHGGLTTITSIVMSVYQDKKFRLFMKRLAAVDDTLEELGTPKMYQKLRAYAKSVLIGWFVCSYVLNIFDMIWWFHAMKDHRCMIIPYITNHFHRVNILMDLLLMTFLWYIGTGFDKVNEHMRYLIIKKEYKLRYLWKKTVPSTGRYIMCTDYKLVLWTSMHLHLELCQIARDLNTIFGPQMTMEMAAYLMHVARVCNFIYMHIQTKGRYVRSTFVWFGMCLYLAIHLASFFSLNYICEKVTAKAKEMEKIIHHMTDNLRYADVRHEIYQFSLQIIHHPLKFTGLGLFYFGNSLLRKFIVAITTFMIIVIQMSIIPKTAKDF